jgi:hypothetical protein
VPLTKRFEPEVEGTAILLTSVVIYQQTLCDVSDSWNLQEHPAGRV